MRHASIVLRWPQDGKDLTHGLPLMHVYHCSPVFLVPLDDDEFDAGNESDDPMEMEGVSAEDAEAGYSIDLDALETDDTDMPPAPFAPDLTGDSVVENDAAMAGASMLPDDADGTNDQHEPGEPGGGDEEETGQLNGEGTQQKAPKAPRAKRVNVLKTVPVHLILFIHFDIEAVCTEFWQDAIVQWASVCHHAVDASSPMTAFPEGSFDCFVKPPPGVTVNEHCVKVSGIDLDDQRVKNGISVSACLQQWFAHLAALVDAKAESAGVSADDISMCLVAWNGSSCDLEWLFRLTQRHNLELPSAIKYFSDPYKAITKAAKAVPWSPKSGAKYEALLAGRELASSLALGTVYELEFGRGIENAHNALADAEAQAELMATATGRALYNRVDAIRPIEEAWAHKEKKAAQRETDKNYPMPEGWTETSADAPHEDDPLNDAEYVGPSSGPNGKAKDAPSKEPYEIFMWFLPATLWIAAAASSMYYANEEPVRIAGAQSADGRRKKNTVYVPCAPNDPRRTSRSKTKVIITAASIITFLGVIILWGGANGGRPISDSWSKLAPLYGIGNHVIASAMTRRAFDWHMR